METEAQRVIDGETGEGGAKEKRPAPGGGGLGAGEVWSVTKRRGKKTTRTQRKGEVEEREGAIQKARRQKDCGERAGVPSAPGRPSAGRRWRASRPQ